MTLFRQVVRVLEDKAFLPGDYVVRVGEAPFENGFRLEDFFRNASRELP